MNPDSIHLDDLTKNFEYFKISNGIDKIDDLNVLRCFAKCYCKLYYKQQEIVSSLAKEGLPSPYQ